MLRENRNGLQYNKKKDYKFMNFFRKKLGIKLKLIVFYEVKLCFLYVVSRFYNINFLSFFPICVSFGFAKKDQEV